MRIITVVCLGFLVSACDMVPKSCEMIYEVPHELIAPEKSKFYHNVQVTKVWGGAKNSCRDESLLRDLELTCALKESLEMGDYLSPTDLAVYGLEVKQESLKILSEGTVQEAQVVLRATLRNMDKNVILFSEPIDTFYRSTYQEAKVPASRIRIAIEQATKGCIEKIIRKIAA